MRSPAGERSSKAQDTPECLVADADLAIGLPQLHVRALVHPAQSLPAEAHVRPCSSHSRQRTHAACADRGQCARHCYALPTPACAPLLLSSSSSFSALQCALTHTLRTHKRTQDTQKPPERHCFAPQAIEREAGAAQPRRACV